MKLLSNAQKCAISRVAKTAWKRASDLGLTDLSESDWRGAEARECCTRRVSEAEAGDFEALMAHFSNLSGDSAGALFWQERAAKTATAQARWRLDLELRKTGKPQAYAEAICLDNFHVRLSQATPDQLRKVMFTIRNRRAMQAHE